MICWELGIYYMIQLSFGLVWVLAATGRSGLHSPDEPSELSQCMTHEYHAGYYYYYHHQKFTLEVVVKHLSAC